ncbi:u4 u6 small nuclear ribonucleoprotein prp3 [Seiridium cupressi]
MDRHGSPALGPQNGSSRVSKGGESAAERLAALKARVAAAINTSSNKAPTAGSTKGTSGLNVPLHPALLGDAGNAPKPASRNNSLQQRSAQSRNDGAKSSAQPKSKQQKQLDLSGPSPDEVKANPYYDPSLQGPAPRQPRQLQFNDPGKYIQQANAIRRQEKLDELKKKIAASTQKAADEDADVQKNFLIDAPPEVEWYDEGFVRDNNYDVTNIDEIHALVQHPVPIESDSTREPAAKPMYLTAKEQKRVRRLRRAAVMAEERAKQRLGLLPPQPNKVTLNNMFKVLGDEAILDPSAAENRVRREISERKDKHLQENEERKLSKEEKAEKIARNQEKDVAREVHLLVYKINNLSNGSIRWKLSKNAEQLGCTGALILCPKFCLCICEAGPFGARKYRKLVEDRIDFTQNAPDKHKETSHELKEWLKATDAEGNLKDMSSNEARLVFAGEVKAQAFSKFSSRVCETEQDARSFLARVKMENFWNLAKSMV